MRMFKLYNLQEYPEEQNKHGDMIKNEQDSFAILFITHTQMVRETKGSIFGGRGRNILTVFSW